MSDITHSANYEGAYGNETVYASGITATLYNQDPPTQVSDFTAFDYAYNEAQTNPLIEYMQTAKKAAGQKGTSKKTFNEGKSIVTGMKKLHLQTMTWLQKAIANYGSPGYQECKLTGKIGSTATGLSAATQYYFKITTNKQTITEYDITTGTGTDFDDLIPLINTATQAIAQCCLVGGDLRFIANDPNGTTSTMALAAGTTGTDLFATLTDFTTFDSAVAGTAGNEGGLAKSTFWETFKDGQARYNTFGNYIFKYTLSIAAGEGGVSQQFEYRSYNVTDSVYAGVIPDSLDPETVAISIWDQFELAVNGRDVELETQTLNFETTFIEPDKKAAGSAEHKFPYYVEAEITSNISQRTYDADLFKSMQTGTKKLIPIVLEFGTNTLIITNLKLVKDSLNMKEVPAKGIKTYTYDLEIGDSCGILFATS